MSKRNETRYAEALDAMANGADDEEIRRTYGFAPYVIKALRATLADRGPKW
ncbi:MAG: hypothetical protein SOI13_01490 [Bifidobacterium mongoliense]|jgi:hypothetical protein|uniref:hypothetical protein n=1 Tax=Bifidobacterium mongoliense TaxID=518643 RepID=UPI002F35B725